MIYFDTSFLAPLFLTEETSVRVERTMARLGASELAASHWTRVEFASLLAREVRMGAMSEEVAFRVDAEFQAVLQETFAVILPDANDYERAREYLGHHRSGLRAGDALHLAIARNREAEAIYSLDKLQVKACRSLDLPMKTLN